jgi:hypothetical protein
VGFALPFEGALLIALLLTIATSASAQGRHTPRPQRRLLLVAPKLPGPTGPDESDDELNLSSQHTHVVARDASGVTSSTTGDATAGGHL